MEKKRKLKDFFEHRKQVDMQSGFLYMPVAKAIDRRLSPGGVFGGTDCTPASQARNDRVGAGPTELALVFWGILIRNAILLKKN